MTATRSAFTIKRWRISYPIRSFTKSGPAQEVCFRRSSMNVVTERNFEQVYPREFREVYWEKVQRSLERIPPAGLFSSGPQKGCGRCATGGQEYSLP